MCSFVLVVSCWINGNSVMIFRFYGRSVSLDSCNDLTVSSRCYTWLCSGRNTVLMACRRLACVCLQHTHSRAAYCDIRSISSASVRWFIEQETCCHAPIHPQRRNAMITRANSKQTLRCILYDVNVTYSFVSLGIQFKPKSVLIIYLDMEANLIVHQE